MANILERYDTIETLGKGGMGAVYLVEDKLDHSRWAMKKEELTDYNVSYIESEIHLLSRLTHPALPKIREWEFNGNFVFIVMEYVDGPTLAELLKQNTSIAENYVRDWALQLADVLEYLHGINPPVVYRDLKPGNIMMDSAGKIRLIDFGIAQEYNPANGYTDDMLVLSKGYAAPEQYDTRYASDVRTDIYSLGVTMHYMITGKNPNKPPYHFEPVRKMNKNISFAMEKIIKNCLWEKPGKRYQSASLLKAELLHIDRVQKNEIAKRRLQKIIGVFVGVAVICIGTILFISTTKLRNGKINEYYELLDEAVIEMNEGNFDEADELLSEAIDTYPDVEDAYIQKGYWFIEKGQYQDAANYARDEIIPTFSDIFNNADFLEMMGDCFMGAGDYKSAVDYYTLCLDIEPDNKKCQRKREQCMDH